MLCCSLATNELPSPPLSVILLFVTFPVVSVFARSLILGVTVRTQHGFFFLTLPHTPLSASFIVLFLSLCLSFFFYVTSLFYRDGLRLEEKLAKSCRFCLSFSTILTTSIFPSFIRSWLSTNPFSLFRALCILSETVFCF